MPNRYEDRIIPAHQRACAYEVLAEFVGLSKCLRLFDLTIIKSTNDKMAFGNVVLKRIALMTRVMSFMDVYAVDQVRELKHTEQVFSSWVNENKVLIEESVTLTERSMN